MFAALSILELCSPGLAGQCACFCNVVSERVATGLAPHGYYDGLSAVLSGSLDPGKAGIGFDPAGARLGGGCSDVHYSYSLVGSFNDQAAGVVLSFLPPL